MAVGNMYRAVMAYRTIRCVAVRKSVIFAVHNDT